ncbi:deoxyribodipyrimidine photolyase [Gordonia paraffinivorans]|uniref:cryptochrome/photolyase family protein n=1 Tax=Gordonia paraffinivorans TaxID=175628 RepID=UPI001C92DFE9|nr:deoxyribodipyrimidine photo-lyase [Gordonia paraffinivorans]MBY4575248.1 deoxyribodipyrimidine photolyase [Gordonia paraffinivorans]
MWLRRDLRLGDLPALQAARGTDDSSVLLCFVVDPRLERSSGERRLAFLFDSLRELDDKLDGRLLIVRGRPDEEIPRLARAVDAEAVHISADFTPFGRRRDEAVAEALGEVPLEATGSPYLVSPGRVTKDDGEPYKVFTPFFRRWRDHGWRRPADSAVPASAVVDPADIANSGRIAVSTAPVKLSFPAGEDAARQRWAEFVDADLADYDEIRDDPAADATSRMSAYLKYGNIHPRTLAVDLGKGKGAQAYLRELAFRDFYADVLWHWPHSLWHNWNRRFDAIELDTDDAAYERFEAWKAGRTGFPLVDAGMRQLNETGWMHNRVRMITASFLVKDLHLPWWWGAEYFLEQLVDGDMASNNHGWQWAAGTGTDAAPYFRVFNPQTQAKKFDPKGEYVRRWAGDVEADDYPEPIVDHSAERAEALRRYGEIGEA